jgi:hypothetical protein
MRKMSLLASVAVVIVAVGLSGGVAIAQVPQHLVTLTGAKETQTADPNGSGEFSWSLDGTRLCYLLTAKKIGTAAAAHIHRGAVGVAGPVRVELTAPNPASVGCKTISSALATALRDHPRRFYVNVHTAVFPNGAIRAQL